MNKPGLSPLICSTICGISALASGSSMEETGIPIAESEPLTNITFVVFDTETTGWSGADGRIIEIGAVKFLNGRLIAKKSWLINPGIKITEESRRVHGISDAMVENAPSFHEVFPKFAAFSKDSIMLAHNAGFDAGFVSAELKRNNISPPGNIILDTLRMARKWFPDLQSHSLENLLKELSIPRSQEHRALSDAECTMAVFLKGISTMPEQSALKDLKKLAGRPLCFKADTK